MQNLNIRGGNATFHYTPTQLSCRYVNSKVSYRLTNTLYIILISKLMHLKARLHGWTNLSGYSMQLSQDLISIYDSIKNVGACKRPWKNRITYHIV